ncbi:MAG TPA: DNA adenine methylase [Candidatus Accumulibacter phosphatis]|nr:MAG: DNA adenine methylase [Candidatus Accumulibacter sp. SK-11]HAY28984.1 adenine methyltransferase [Accumulibacter sp.]HCN67278.1 adenine methyltransferase [Accumulibacter sp.]HRL74233.1 DNA adenine methylase [Candidatus Accumulibacter phosphatis]HRQ93522.1 DNA adenine methylase [Candidatus Accumulibacter phosphatis]
MRPSSPLRYPGGKGCLSDFLSDLLEINQLIGCDYFEPYAGGAGAGLNLLCTGRVRAVHINDADPRVHALWCALLDENERFIDQIQSVTLNVEEWRRQHAICAAGDSVDRFALGFAAFYMNRCNRSGVLKGAGPIGGLHQSGEWRLDARFNRVDLVARVRVLGELRDRIHVTGLDAIEFLKQEFPVDRARAFVYADPPYLVRGRKLYLNGYGPGDHAELARYLGTQRVLPWLVSYDDEPLIRDLYAEHQIDILPIRYSLQRKRAAHELLIAPHHVYVPTAGRSARRAHLAYSTVELQS